MKLTMKENIPEGILPEAGVRRVSKTLPAPPAMPVGAKGVWGIPAGRMCLLHVSFFYSDQWVASNKEVVLNDLWLALLHLGNVTLICRIFATISINCIVGC